MCCLKMFDVTQYYRNDFCLRYLFYKQNIIKSPRYTGSDFMFLYRFSRRRRRLQILVHAIHFEQLFWISLIFCTIVGPDL